MPGLLFSQKGLCYIWPDKGGYLPNLSKGSETLVMTSEGLGEMFQKWICRHIHRITSAGVDEGPSGGSSMRRPGSEDLHWRQRKFCKSKQHASTCTSFGPISCCMNPLSNYMPHCKFWKGLIWQKIKRILIVEHIISKSLISGPLLRMHDFTASFVWLRAGG